MNEETAATCIQKHARGAAERIRRSRAGRVEVSAVARRALWHAERDDHAYESGYTSRELLGRQVELLRLQQLCISSLAPSRHGSNGRDLAWGRL